MTSSGVLTGLIALSLVLVMGSIAGYAASLSPFFQPEATAQDNQTTTDTERLQGNTNESAPINASSAVQDGATDPQTQTSATPLASLNGTPVASLTPEQPESQDNTQQASGQGSVQTGQAGQGGQSGSNNQGDSGQIAPETPKPQIPTPAQEEEYRQVLVMKYNWAVNHYNTLCAGYNQLITELNAGHSRPGASFSGTLGQNGMAIFMMNMEETANNIPTNSKYYQSGQTLRKMYSDLGNGDVFLNRIKGFNPITVRSELTSRLTSDGRVRFLVDFEKHAAQVSL